MATLTATWVQVGYRATSSSGATLPVADLSTATRLTNMTTSSSSALIQSGGSDWTSPGNGILVLACDGDVDIAAGTAPTAAATAGLRVYSGITREVTVAKDHKVAVKDA